MHLYKDGQKLRGRANRKAVPMHYHRAKVVHLPQVY